MAAWTQLVGELSGRLEDARRREARTSSTASSWPAAIAEQRFVIANLKTLCEGGRVGCAEGGLSTSADFIGVTRDAAEIGFLWRGFGQARCSQ